jgi:hypothetical protein
VGKFFPFPRAFTKQYTDGKIGASEKRKGSVEEVNSAMFQKIREYLEKNSISYRALHHRPTRTSEESARARGENISIGGKALVMKIGESFRLFVLSASRKLDSSKVRGYFNTRKTRFTFRDDGTRTRFCATLWSPNSGT